jgi:hypothetical protein
MTAWRVAWLASPRDAWLSSGWRDVEGESGSFIGHQLEVRVRWHPFPQNVSLEGGAAVLLGGELAAQVRPGPGVYAYAQLTGKL